MSSPIICFGQQPCGFFPRRFLHAKFVTARRLQQENRRRDRFLLPRQRPRPARDPDDSAPPQDPRAGDAELHLRQQSPAPLVAALRQAHSRRLAGAHRTPARRLRRGPGRGGFQASQSRHGRELLSGNVTAVSACSKVSASSAPAIRPYAAPRARSPTASPTSPTRANSCVRAGCPTARFACTRAATVT